MMDLTKRSWKRPGGPELTEDLLSLGHVSGRRLSLLDVGAGDGLAMEYLAEQHPDWSITGIDPETAADKYPHPILRPEPKLYCAAAEHHALQTALLVFQRKVMMTGGVDLVI